MATPELKQILYILTGQSRFLMHLPEHLPVSECTYLLEYRHTEVKNNIYGQESESAEIGFLWGPKHEQFSNASLSALNLKKHFETWNEVL